MGWDGNLGISAASCFLSGFTLCYDDVQVPMFSASGLRVQYLRVWEKSAQKVHSRQPTARFLHASCAEVQLCQLLNSSIVGWISSADLRIRCSHSRVRDLGRYLIVASEADPGLVRVKV